MILEVNVKTGKKKERKWTKKEKDDLKKIVRPVKQPLPQ